MKTGFTLIELLVVVLIIGILAAIALPQYQKAVERSRTAEAIQYLGDWANAQSIYYMQNNEFTEDIDDGDISLPTPGDAFTYEPTVSGVIAELVATRTSGIYEGCNLQIFVAGNGQIEKLCYAEEGKEAFCTIAQAAGYVVAEEEEEGSCPNGVWVPGHMVGDRFIEGKCVVLNPISPMG